MGVFKEQAKVLAAEQAQAAAEGAQMEADARQVTLKFHQELLEDIGTVELLKKGIQDVILGENKIVLDKPGDPLTIICGGEEVFYLQRHPDARQVRSQPKKWSHRGPVSREVAARTIVEWLKTE